MNSDLEPTTAAGNVAADLLTEAQARELTTRIRGVLHTGHKLLVSAWRGRAWLPLGYDSWDDYCAGEFTDTRALRIDADARRGIVEEMRAEGMSTRAIGSGLGVDHKTVARDLAASAAHAADERPAMVTSLDGRQRPATRPAPSAAHHSVSTTAHLSDAPQNRVEAALAEHVDDSALRLSRWRKAFAQSLSRAGDALRFDPADVALQADPRLREAHRALVAQLGDHLGRVDAGPRMRPVPSDGVSAAVRAEAEKLWQADARVEASHRRVESALDAHSGDAGYRDAIWRRGFHKALTRAGELVVYPASEIAATADDAQAGLLRDYAAALTALAADVDARRSTALATVTPLGSPRAARDGRTR